MLNEKKAPGVRLHFLDTLRGFSIIYVVFFHAVFNLAGVEEWAYAMLFSPGMKISQFIFVGLLIFISGICTRLTRSNLKRGIKTLLCALTVTLVTFAVMPNMTIIFGILHFFAAAMLIYALVGRFVDKIPSCVAFPLFIILWLLTYNIYELVGNVTNSIILYILGFNTGHFSADYYPLIPHVFLFLAGTVAGRYIKSERLPKFLYKNYLPPISFIGRHTLFIYMIHQPILYGITWLTSII